MLSTAARGLKHRRYRRDRQAVDSEHDSRSASNGRRLFRNRELLQLDSLPTLDFFDGVPNEALDVAVKRIAASITAAPGVQGEGAEPDQVLDIASRWKQTTEPHIDQELCDRGCFRGGRRPLGQLPSIDEASSSRSHKQASENVNGESILSQYVCK